jgi:porphobilinogen synthase
MRRMRRTEPLRALVREIRLHPGELIYPLFLVPGEGVRKPISSMPGCFNLSIDEAVKEAEECANLGLGGLLLFGLPAEKDEQGTGAWADDGIVQQALRAFRRERKVKNLLLIADVCLCEYTSHGHCGLVTTRTTEDGEAGYDIANDTSVTLLAKAAVSLSLAGADIVAPSDMMDGRVAAIRKAADSSPQFGDRRSYQMDGANAREAMREIEADVREGADMILMKPAMPYLDIVRMARDRFDLPLGAYQVSGEYSMLLAAMERGWLERDRAMLESLVSIRRAGAEFIVTYFAKEAGRLLEGRGL